MVKRIVRKDVVYNGGTESYYHCSDNKELVPYKHYIVEEEYDRGCRTDYKLVGLDGHYNSMLFHEPQRQLLSVSHYVPKVGSNLVVTVVDTGKTVIISSLRYVEPITSVFYKVVTNSKDVYLVALVQD